MMSLFSSRIPSRLPYFIYLLYLFSLLLAVIISDLSCFSWPGQFWGVLVKYFVECPSIGTSPMFFSWFDGGYVFWGGWLYIPWTWLTMSMLALITQLRSLHCEVTRPHSPFLTLPALQEWGGMFYLLEGRARTWIILNTSVWELCLSSLQHIFLIYINLKQSHSFQQQQ